MKKKDSVSMVKTLYGHESIGYHNADLDASVQRLVRGQTYKNLSTIWLTPIRKPRECPCGCKVIVYPGFHSKVMSSWMALQRPMNQPFIGPLFFEGDEVGIAFQKGFEMVLDHPELSKWKYILTVEEDNLPPIDGILKLYEAIQQGYDAVGGLYWTKGPAGQPMCYGDPKVMPRNFVPQVPIPDTVQHCNGLGMGFNLYKMEMFKKMPRPWFKTVQEPGKTFTQDLWFYNNAGAAGFKFACHTGCKVGHLDVNTGQVW